MKMTVFILSLLLTLLSCATGDQKNNVQDLKVALTPIDNNSISQIQLLVADTSIIDLPSKQLTKLIDIGEGQSFVDSFGNPFYKPSQIITFKGLDKESLLDIFNSFLDSSQQNIEQTTCITLYNHIFILYDSKNKISEQIDFAFNCPMQFYFLHRGRLVQVKDENSEIIMRLINKLKVREAYIPDTDHHRHLNR